MKILIVICFLWAACANNVQAQDADAILAQSKQASGGDAWNSIRSISLKSETSLGGVPMLEEIHLDTATGSYLATYYQGTFEAPGHAANANGYDGKTAWEQDAAGYSNSITDAGSLRQVISESYRARLAYWFPERAPAKRVYLGKTHEGNRDFDDIQITPVGGQPFEFWIDSQTHLIDRIVEQEGLTTNTILFLKYLASGALQIPQTKRYADGQTAYDLTLTLRQVSTSTDAETISYSIPPPPMPNYTFPKGKEAVSVPFHLVKNLILVPIQINGKGPFIAMLDTGGSNALSSTLAQKMQFRPEGILEVQGVGEGAVPAGIAPDFSLQIGGLTLASHTCSVLDLSMLQPIQAIIGYETLRPFIVKIDYGKQILTLTRPEKFPAPHHGMVMPLFLNGGHPVIEGSVDSIPGLFVLDTGAENSLTLCTPFVENNALRAKYKVANEAARTFGIGGVLHGQVAHIGTLDLGNFTETNVETLLSSQKSGLAAGIDVAGNVGADLLCRFNITFDYGHGQAIFERNEEYGKPQKGGQSGMSVRIQGNQWFAVDVMPGGAAAKAGIKNGDQILQIEGKNTQKMSIFDLGEFGKRPPGTKMTLRIQSGTKTRQVTLIRTRSLQEHKTAK